MLQETLRLLCDGGAEDVLNRWYTSPTTSVEVVGNASRSAASMAMFWLAPGEGGELLLHLCHRRYLFHPKRGLTME
jgi:hypothetical protein